MHDPIDPRFPLDRSPALLLTEAIERHRDEKWKGEPVTDPTDARLYDAALWFRSQQQELEP